MSPLPKSDLEHALQGCKGAFFAVAGFSMVINLLMLAPSIYMLQVYDRVVPTGNQATLVMLTLIVFVLFLTMSALEWVRSQILIRVSARLETQLNQRALTASYMLSLHSGGQRASTQAIDDLSGLRQFLTGSGLFAFFDAPWMPIYIALMFVFHPWYGWFSVITAVILIIVAFANERFTANTLSEANKLAMFGRAQVTANLRNAEVVHAMGMMNNLSERWLSNADQVLLLQSIASSRAGLIGVISKVARLTSQSMILGLGAYLVIEREITPGLMIAGSILLGRALAPIDMMIANWRGFVSARGQYQRLRDILLKIPAPPLRMELPAPQGAIQFDAAQITPPGAKAPVLKGVSLTIEQGDLLGVIGASGSGKSTFARALLGIWPAMSGKVRLDGADVSDWDRERLGPFLGYLPQDIELFDGTVSENIARFGKVDPNKVVDAARMAGVHELILQLPEGYDTLMGSSGGMLSGGQRQRIALARALYGNPVVVVLDEPNSNLDEKGEAALANALQQLKQKGTTVILVSHRQNILAKVDKLLVLNEGQLVVYGPRDQVISYLQKQVQQAVPVKSDNTPI